MEDNVVFLGLKELNSDHSYFVVLQQDIKLRLQLLTPDHFK